MSQLLSFQRVLPSPITLLLGVVIFILMRCITLQEVFSQIYTDGENSFLHLYNSSHHNTNKNNNYLLPFKTQIPMYFINLARSQNRRVYMEKLFGGCGKLSRIDAVDSNDIEALRRHLYVDGDIGFEEYINSIVDRKSRIGEIALTLSHLKAVNEALKDKADAALILEDDASPILAPFWPMSLDNVVVDITSKFPDWCLLRLQHTAGGETTYYSTLRKMMKSSNLPTSIYQIGRHSNYGLVAYLISKRGMERLMSVYRRENGKFDLQKATDRQFGYVADLMLPLEFTDDQIFKHVPPLFTYWFYEDSTGVRGSTTNVIGQHQKHEQSIVDSIQMAVEYYQYQIGIATKYITSPLSDENMKPSRWLVTAIPKII